MIRIPDPASVASPSGTAAAPSAVAQPGVSAEVASPAGVAAPGLPTSAAGTATGPGAVMAAAFERLQALGPARSGASTESLVARALEDALATTTPGLSSAGRDRLAGEIARALLDDPVMRQRLERLLGAPA